MQRLGLYALLLWGLLLTSCALFGGCARSGTGADDSGIGTVDLPDVTDTSDDGSSVGPCDAVVPATARVIAADTSIVDDDVVAWVCRNTTLSYAGTGGTFFLGQRAQLVLGEAGGNTAYAETGADLHNFGTNTLVVGDAGDVVDEADGGAMITVCPDLRLDLAGAPDPGC